MCLFLCQASCCMWLYLVSGDHCCIEWHIPLVLVAWNVNGKKEHNYPSIISSTPQVRKPRFIRIQVKWVCYVHLVCLRVPSLTLRPQTLLDSFCVKGRETQHVATQATNYHRYGASARAAAANSGSHLSPLASSFSLLYSNSSLVSVAYSALGATCQAPLAWFLESNAWTAICSVANTQHKERPNKQEHHGQVQKWSKWRLGFARSNLHSTMASTGQLSWQNPQ